jgi:hypothetical protein
MATAAPDAPAAGSDPAATSAAAGFDLAAAATSAAASAIAPVDEASDAGVSTAEESKESLMSAFRSSALSFGPARALRVCKWIEDAITNYSKQMDDGCVMNTRLQYGEGVRLAFNTYPAEIEVSFESPQFLASVEACLRARNPDIFIEIRDKPLYLVERTIQFVLVIR